VDLDGDGDPDLLATSQSTNKVVWFENLGGHYGVLQPLDDDAGYQWPVSAGDVDGDGDPDVVAAGGVENVAWYRNSGDDCNANGILDSCEPDCNANGFADDCDLRLGLSIDCDGNDSPDECDAACPDCDQDGDGCLDGVDSAVDDPFVCGDSEGDGCEDCSAGLFAPESDGPDADNDLFCDSGDCDPLDGTVWAAPGAAGAFTWSPSNKTDFTWLPPLHGGALLVSYDTLRSDVASDFHGLAWCLDVNDSDRASSDGNDPDPGQVFYYLIRAENGCPGVVGSMGTDSAGAPRSGRSCP